MSLIKFRSKMSEGPTIIFEPESESYFNRVNTEKSFVEKVIDDILIKDLKAVNSLALGVDNLATVFDYIGLRAVFSQSTDDYKLGFLTGTPDISWTSGDPDFESGVGVGNLSVGARASYTQGLDLLVNVADKDDIELGAFVTAAEGIPISGENQKGLMGNFGSTSTYLFLLNIGDETSDQIRFAHKVSSVSSKFVAADIADERGMHVAKRIAPTLQGIYNGVVLDTDDHSSTALGFPAGTFGFAQLSGGSALYGYLGKIGFDYFGKASLINTNGTYTAVRKWLLSKGVLGI